MELDPFPAQNCSTQGLHFLLDSQILEPFILELRDEFGQTVFSGLSADCRTSNGIEMGVCQTKDKYLPAILDPSSLLNEAYGSRPTK